MPSSMPLVSRFTKNTLDNIGQQKCNTLFIMKLYNTPGLSQIYFRRSPSPPYLKKSSYESTGFFFVYCTHRGDEKPRPGFDNWRQPVGQTVNAVSGLPAGRAKRVNPPLTAIFKEEPVRKYGLFFRILHTPGAPAHVC